MKLLSVAGVGVAWPESPATVATNSDGLATLRVHARRGYAEAGGGMDICNALSRYVVL